MRKYWLALLLIGGLLACGVSWQGSASAEPSGDFGVTMDPQEAAEVALSASEERCGWLSNYFFAKKAAGTYLITFWFTECVEWIDGGGEGCLPDVYEPECDECTEEVYNTAGSGMVTIHSDGTCMMWSENAYGIIGAPPDAVPGGRRHDSPAIGVWERTGRNTIKCNNMIIAKYEADATNAFIVRQNMEITFSENFTRVDIELPVQLVFAAGEDLDEDGVDDNYECLLWSGEPGSEAPDPNSTDCAWLNVYAGAAVGTRFQVLE